MVWWKNCRENAHTRQTIQKIYIKKIHVDEKTCKEACNTVQNLIRRKKEACLEEVLKRDMANSKKIGKHSKQLGLPEKRLPCTDVCLKAEEEFIFELWII